MPFLLLAALITARSPTQPRARIRHSLAVGKPQYVCLYICPCCLLFTLHLAFLCFFLFSFLLQILSALVRGFTESRLQQAKYHFKGSKLTSRACEVPKWFRFFFIKKTQVLLSSCLVSHVFVFAFHSSTLAWFQDSNGDNLVIPFGNPSHLKKSSTILTIQALLTAQLFRSRDAAEQAVRNIFQQRVKNSPQGLWALPNAVEMAVTFTMRCYESRPAALLQLGLLYQQASSSSSSSSLVIVVIVLTLFLLFFFLFFFLSSSSSSSSIYRSLLPPHLLLLIFFLRSFLLRHHRLLPPPFPLPLPLPPPQSLPLCLCHRLDL